jgi:hypothetical protein
MDGGTERIYLWVYVYVTDFWNRKNRLGQMKRIEKRRRSEGNGKWERVRVMSINTWNKTTWNLCTENQISLKKINFENVFILIVSKSSMRFVNIFGPCYVYVQLSNRERICQGEKLALEDCTVVGFRRWQLAWMDTKEQKEVQINLPTFQ